ncbi:hypothetical protein [Stenotrophomonas sp. WZN-1]|uniref:hypothetical protein n=1 Tax=Stenotrophomonas sp. WZN-1 TaxID=2005046 RepID=UPI002FC62EF9
MTERTVTSVSPACGRFDPARVAASWEPIQSGSPSPCPAMNMLPLTALLVAVVASASASPARAADTPSAASNCVQLGSDQQLVRAGASRNILLRNGQDHYVVHFQDDCSAAGYSRKLSFSTEGQQGLLCTAGRSQLQTDSSRCTVAQIEPVDAATFKKKARQRSR